MREASFLYINILKTGERDIAEAGRSEIKDAIEAYTRACARPPNPPGSLTPKESAQYRRELSQLLKKKCRATVTETLTHISARREDVPETVRKELDALAKHFAKK